MAQLLSLVFSALGDKGDAFGVKTKKEPSSKKNAESSILVQCTIHENINEN